MEIRYRANVGVDQEFYKYEELSSDAIAIPTDELSLGRCIGICKAGDEHVEWMGERDWVVYLE